LIRRERIMKITHYLFLFGTVFLPVILFGQLTSFNAGPEDGRYNICEGETVSLRTFNAYFNIGPNPVTVDWMNSPVPASEKNLVRPTFSPPGPGTYDFSVRMSDLSFPEASFVITFKIVVVGKPFAKAGDDMNLCIGTSIKLSAVETLNSTSLAWSHNGLGVLHDSSTLAPTYIPATGEQGTVKLVLKVTGNATCGGESSDDLLLNYFPLPTADIVSQTPQMICSNEEFKINAVVSGHNSFRWHVFPSDRMKNLKGQGTLSPTYIPEIDETGHVSVILEAIGPGCSVFDTLEMRVSRTQVVSSSATGIILACPGELVKMAVTTAPGFTYLWNTGAKANLLTVSGKSTTQNYSVVATNQDGCSQMVDFSIEPKPAPIAGFTMLVPSKVCSNQPFKITTDASGYDSFKWHVVPKDKKGILIDDNTLNPTYVPQRDEGGLVQIILETIGAECTRFDTLSLNISQLVVGLSHLDGKVNACEGENINLFVTTTPGCTFLWNTGAKTNSINVIARSLISPYSVIVTNPDGCSQSVTYNITTKAAPVADIKLATNEKLCSNKSFKIEATASGYNSYNWYVNPVANKGSLSETNTLAPTYTPAKDESGIVRIILETIGNECTTYDTLSVNINQMNIDPSHPEGKVLACSNENVNLYVSSSPGLSYNWSTGAKTNGIIVKAISPLSNYSVEVTNTNGCKENIHFSITTKPGPTGEITTVAPPLICSNQSIKLNATASEFASYKWHIFPQSNKGTLSENNTLNPTYVPKKDETGEVLIILETIGAECTVFDTLRLNISRIYTEISHPNGNISACEGDVVTLSVTASPGYTYLWNNGLKTSFISVKPPIGGNGYSVDITNMDGCKQTSNFNVNVLNRPVIQLNLNNENSILTVEPAGLARYSFFGKNKMPLYEGTNNIYDYSNILMTTDTIYVIAFSSNGCSSDLSGQYANYEVLPKLKPVDAFSPNNDGVNDLLMPGRRIMVIDRTSKVLYEGYSGWDGTYLGKEMPQGTYFYLMYDRNGNIYYKGPVTLLRNNVNL